MFLMTYYDDPSHLEGCLGEGKSIFSIFQLLMGGVTILTDSGSENLVVRIPSLAPSWHSQTRIGQNRDPSHQKLKIENRDFPSPRDPSK